MVNSPLIKPCFLGKHGIGGVPLDCHDMIITNFWCSKVVRYFRERPLFSSGKLVYSSNISMSTRVGCNGYQLSWGDSFYFPTFVVIGKRHVITSPINKCFNETILWSLTFPYTHENSHFEPETNRPQQEKEKKQHRHNPTNLWDTRMSMVLRINGLFHPYISSLFTSPK